MPRQGAAVRAPQAQLPVLHMTERRKGRMPDAPGHAPAMGSARNGNPHAGLLYPAVKCNFGKYRWTGEGLPRVTIECSAPSKMSPGEPYGSCGEIGTVFAAQSLKQSVFHRN